MTTKVNISLSSPQASRILFNLMVPSMMMPLASSMFVVALPVIRDEFQLSAEMAAWVATIFSLPFVILMPVYGRLSDGLGKRRLILAGVAIFALGTSIALLANGLGGIMAGRAIQGIGASGIMPLAMALITVIFRPGERGRALGIWSTVGPATAFIGPLMAGFIVATWGWRASFVPALVVAMIAIFVVYKGVPAGFSRVRPNFLRSFDWLGVILMAAAATTLLFFLSSRPITGVSPLQDWRLFLVTLFLLSAFLWWEQRRPNPFVNLGAFKNKLFSRASFCASARMFVMSGGLFFLLPLYLVDIHQLDPAQSGFLLMINPGTMVLIVRIGGRLSDRWGSRNQTLLGFSAQAVVMLGLSQLPAAAPLWAIALFLFLHGLGAGLMLAALHSAALGDIQEEDMGASSGLYSMIRFFGAVFGVALGGVLLQYYLELALPTIKAYQIGFQFFAGIAGLGFLVALGMVKR